MRHRRLAAIALATTVLLSACGSSQEDVAGVDNTDEAVAGGNIIDLQTYAAGEPQHIDPALADDVQSSQIARLLFDGLTKTDVKGEVKNAVAVNVMPSDDAKVWTFVLRNNVQYDNGDLLVASDFKFAWQRVLDPALGSRMAGRFSLIKGATDVAAGKSTDLSGVVANDAMNSLTVTLNDPYRDFPALVSTTPFSPLPQKLFRDDPTLSSKFETGALVGNGPFRMAGPWEHDRSIKLVRNDKYYGGIHSHAPYVDSIDFRVSKDIDSAYTEFLRGKSSVGRVPGGQFQEAESRYGDNVITTSLLATEYWGFNFADPGVGGTDNLKLRQAIALTIDKKDIVSKLYAGARPPATGWAPPGLPGYQLTFDNGVRNVEKAKDLLREWGKTPPELKISFNSGAGHEDKAAIIQQNLKDIGIKAALDPIAQADYGTAVAQGTVSFFRGSWTADFVSYDNFIAPLFTSPPTGDQNVYGYRNGKIDSLVQQARLEPDVAKRNLLYNDAERLMLDDQVLVPLDWPTAGLVHSNAIRDLFVEPLGYVDYTEAWIRK